jgi:hypothetical protein
MAVAYPLRCDSPEFLAADNLLNAQNFRQEKDTVGVIVSEYCAIAPNVKLVSGFKLSKFVNISGCDIGENTNFGAFV